MSLEAKIDELIGALTANTKAHGGGAAAAKAATAAGAATPAKGAAKGPTFEAVKAQIVAVKDEKGKPAAQAIIKQYGKADVMANIKPAQFAAVIKACEELMAEEAPTDEEPTEDEDTL